MQNVLVKYHSKYSFLKFNDKGDWVDLKSAKTVEIHNGHRAMISLGVSMQLPKGKEAHILPRSSTYKTWGIMETNGMGIIDNSYCGDGDVWHFPCICLDGKEELVKAGFLRRIAEKFVPELKWFRYGTIIQAGDRICQFKIVDKMSVADINDENSYDFVEVLTLGNKDRGGFGSTGIK